MGWGGAEVTIRIKIDNKIYKITLKCDVNASVPNVRLAP